MALRVGHLCYSTWQGLGVMSRAFYTHGIITDVVVVEHSRTPTQRDWYPGKPHIPIRELSNHGASICSWAEQLDLLLLFENAFYWPVVNHCKDRGIPVVMVPMYECYLKNPPAQCTHFISPSLLDKEYFPQSVHLPIPVEVKWKQRTRVKTFVHNAGHFGLRGRNGTKELIDALPYIKSPINLILRMQEPPHFHLPTDQRLTVRQGTAPYETLWDEGDAFVFPEKFNGLSLPLQEARAAGMLVIGTDRFPMNQWLPTAPLIKSTGRFRTNIGGSYLDLTEEIVTPRDIAAKIDEYFDTDITEYSRQGKEWAESMSWEMLGPRWRAELERIVSCR